MDRIALAQSQWYLVTQFLTFLFCYFIITKAFTYLFLFIIFW